MSHEDSNRLSGHEKDVLRAKYGHNKLSGSELDEGRKNKKKEMAKKMNPLHPSSSDKELGNRLFKHKPSDGYNTPEHTYYLEQLSPQERARVNTHMARLHRRKNK